MPQTKVKKRRVMTRDHDDIANHIQTELKARRDTDWRKQHEERWREVDRQIAMEPPLAIREDLEDQGDWHNAIQLGDLTDASETITADILRLVFPTERKWFQPNIEIPPVGIDEDGRPIPPPTELQRQENGILRSLMAQQHKDFGVRGRAKLGLKEILHHGSVVAEVHEQTMRQYNAGTTPKHLKAPVPEIHSMWNCYPDSSPVVQSTETFYTGSMIIVKSMPLSAALEMPNWINKDRLQEAQKAKKKGLDDHIEIVTYYGDIFLKRHDGNVVFPNRKTVISGHVFLESTVYKTPYSPIIYIGYERDDVRDPYFTSPIVKRAPTALFATHMANKTMDAVDLAVDPPLNYDKTDQHLRGDPPQIYPGARYGTRGGTGVTALSVGDPGTGFAAMQWAMQEVQKGTTVDATRRGVSPGTEQTATEVIKTEQRAEVREVEFANTFEGGFLLPYLIMQHDLNLMSMEPYRFRNDEPHTPDFMRATRKDLRDRAKEVIFEVTGSRTLLGEQERQNRFIQTSALAGQNEAVARETDWQEVSRQLWEDSKQKDPERFLRSSDRNEEIQAVQAEMQAAFEQQMQQVQQQVGQLQEQAQKATDEARTAKARAEQAQLQQQQANLRVEQEQTKNVTLQEQLKLTRDFERAEDRLQKLQLDIERRENQLAQREAQQGEGSDDAVGRIIENLIQ